MASSSASSSSTKEAVVFILDSSASMANLYGASATMTRWESAKQALESWISDLMIQSKQHEVAVVVCKTAETDHHLDHDHFPNIRLLPSSGGVTRPTVSLLRAIQGLECASDDVDDGTPLRGDLMDGLVVAADALRRRTLGKSYQRSIVILTDACHDIVIDEDQVLQVVDALRDVQCQLHVIGLDFVESAVFEEALPESEAAAVKEEKGSDDDNSDASMESDDEEGDNDSAEPMDSRLETERFLISVARLTGGSVQAAHSLHQILQHKLGRRIATSIRRKCQLRIAPTIDPLSVRVSLLVSKTSVPTLKRAAILLDESDKALKDGLGNFVTSDLERVTDHFDAVNKAIGIDETGRTRAVKFGTDWIPLNDFDLEGLKERSEINITILGYTNQSKIGRGYCMGPSYGVSGGDSTRACAALSALAQAMDRLKSCAIGTFVKTQNADPILVALFPLAESDVTDSVPHRLALLQLPFCGDVQKLTTLPLDDYITPAKQSACDDLIDALLLPPNVQDSTQIPNPAIRSFRQTLVQRAIHGGTTQPIVESRGEWFDVPNLERAIPTLEKFRERLPIKAVKTTNGK